jgi:CheY-like chemotaxis protein
VLGMEATSAADGAEALAALKRGVASGVPFDVMFVDHIMPELDGQALAGQVHAVMDAPPKIVLVTSGIISREGAFVSGIIDAVLEKPVRRADLRYVVGWLPGGIEQPAASTGPEPAASPAADPAVDLRSLSVLVAEDNAINQKVVRAMLAHAGHTARIVANGAEAVAAARDEDFDAVLMDMQMPVLDGIAATRAIRMLPPPRSQVPIIALTADAMTGAKEYYIEAGMDDYLVKPMSISALLDKLKALACGHVSRTACIDSGHVSQV